MERASTCPVGPSNHRENGSDVPLISNFTSKNASYPRKSPDETPRQLFSSRMALGRSAGDMRTRRAGARACRQHRRRHRGDNRENGCRSRTQVNTPKQNYIVHNAGKFKTMATGKRHVPNRPPCTQITRVCEAQSMVNPSSSQLLCNCRRHRARLGSMASRSYLLFGRSIARPLFAPLGFESMLV